MDPSSRVAAEYLQALYQAMATGDFAQIKYLYYKQWKELTTDHFMELEWPSPQQVTLDYICEGNPDFPLFYAELCNRHIFLHGNPGLRHRFESWTNYRALFDMFLEGSVSLSVPLEWLYDLIDEFLYQWQDFHVFRHAPNKDPQEIEILKNNPNVWKTQTVLYYLFEFRKRESLALGAFALVGMSRVHCVLGDFRQCLKTLDPIDIDDQRALVFQVPSCAISLYYHLGFAYLMSKRYSDAVSVLSRVLISHRSTKESSSSFSEEQAVGKWDKVLALATLGVVLCPGLYVDEHVKRIMSEKFEKSFGKDGTRVDVQVVSELFSNASPRLINPAMPAFDGKDQSASIQATQKKWFMADVQALTASPNMLSHLKLYMTIPISKLARYCNTDAEILKQHLMVVRARSLQMCRTVDGSAPIEGNRQLVAEVNFLIAGDMIMVVPETKHSNFAKVFARQALKFQAVVDDLRIG